MNEVPIYPKVPPSTDSSALFDIPVFCWSIWCRMLSFLYFLYISEPTKKKKWSLKLYDRCQATPPIFWWFWAIMSQSWRAGWIQTPQTPVTASGEWLHCLSHSISPAIVTSLTKLLICIIFIGLNADSIFLLNIHYNALWKCSIELFLNWSSYNLKFRCVKVTYIFFCFLLGYS